MTAKMALPNSQLIFIQKHKYKRQMEILKSLYLPLLFYIDFYKYIMYNIIVKFIRMVVE